MTIPSITDPKYRKWKTDNATVMSWFLHSVKPEFSRRYLLFKTTKQIWDSIAQTYSKAGNTTKMYELK